MLEPTIPLFSTLIVPVKINKLNQQNTTILCSSPAFFQLCFCFVFSSLLPLQEIQNSAMEDYSRSRSYSYSHGEGNMMQMESYHGPPRPTPATSYELMSYSTSYAQTQMSIYNNNNNNNNNRDLKLKKGKSTSSSKTWSLNDPELQRKKRVASYKMYSAETKFKGSFRKTFRWFKDRYTQVVYGW